MNAGCGEINGVEGGGGGFTMVYRVRPGMTGTCSQWSCFHWDDQNGGEEHYDISNGVAAPLHCIIACTRI